MDGGAIQLQWIASLPATCLHAAEAVCGGRTLREGPLAAAIAPLARGLGDEIRAAGLPWQRFWQHLVPLSAQAGGHRQLVECCLRKTLGPHAGNDALAGRLAGRIADLVAAARRTTPELVEELDAQSLFLRQQWKLVEETLPRAIARLTDPAILVDSATVIVVAPLQGGGGAAHPWYNSLRIEAVPRDPTPDLPEVLRLAWMLAQLNMDLPILGESLPAAELPSLAAIATVAPTLAAAAQLQLIDADSDSTARAIALWGIADTPAGDLAETLSAWWRTYQDSSPSWSVALTALRRLLSTDPATAEAASE